MPRVSKFDNTTTKVIIVKWVCTTVYQSWFSLADVQDSHVVARTIIQKHPFCLTPSPTLSSPTQTTIPVKLSTLSLHPCGQVAGKLKFPASLGRHSQVITIAHMCLFHTSYIQQTSGEVQAVCGRHGCGGRPEVLANCRIVIPAWEASQSQSSEPSLNTPCLSIACIQTLT